MNGITNVLVGGGGRELDGFQKRTKGRVQDRGERGWIRAPQDEQGASLYRWGR